MEKNQTVLTWNIPSTPTITLFPKQDTKQTNWRSFFSTTESDLFELERECDRLRHDLSQLERENQNQMASLKADYEKLAKHYYESQTLPPMMNEFNYYSKEVTKSEGEDEVAARLILGAAALVMLTLMFA